MASVLFCFVSVSATILTAVVILTRSAILMRFCALPMYTAKFCALKTAVVILILMKIISAILMSYVRALND